MLKGQETEKNIWIDNFEKRISSFFSKKGTKELVYEQKKYQQKKYKQRNSLLQKTTKN